MGILASFLWEPGKDKSAIYYMVLDDIGYDVLTKPQRIVIPMNNGNINAIDGAISRFFDEIKKFKSKNNNCEVKVEHKTVIRRYGKSKKESDYVHNTLTRRCDEEGFTHKRLESKLPASALKPFKAALQTIGVLTQNDEAYIHHLWCIALHATKKTYRAAIKKLWKGKNNIHKMTNENKKQFNKLIK